MKFPVTNNENDDNVSNFEKKAEYFNKSGRKDDF